MGNQVYLEEELGMDGKDKPERNETKTKFLNKAQCLILKSEFKGGNPSPTLPGSWLEDSTLGGLGDCGKTRSDLALSRLGEEHIVCHSMSLSIPFCPHFFACECSLQ